METLFKALSRQEQQWGQIQYIWELAKVVEFFQERTSGMKKAYISGSNRFEGKVLSAHGFGITFDITEADLVVFTGGADISPVMYGEPTHGTTKASPYRDDEDRSNYIKATSLGIPLLGICPVALSSSVR